MSSPTQKAGLKLTGLFSFTSLRTYEVTMMVPVMNGWNPQ